MRQVLPSEIDGSVCAPPSKSIMQRALAAAALSSGKSRISNPSLCEDALAAIGCAKKIGADIEIGKAVIVDGGDKAKGGRMNCGESGLCMRMFAPIAALFEQEFVLTGKGSLAKRRVGMVEEPLRKLGVRCSTNAGLPPIIVQGPMQGGHVRVDGSESSQFLSGLLMALPKCEEDSVVIASGLKSKPYVRMTLALAREFGVEVEHEEELDKFEILGGQAYKPTNHAVEGDWSGAAFMLVAGAIAGKVTVRGLAANSLQADRALISALQRAGAEVRLAQNKATVKKAELVAFDFDATDCPDLFPPLAVLACCCNGTSFIRGAGRLRGKESDRASALISELGALGANISISGDVMKIFGGKLAGGEADSHNDHRIAMACAIAGLASKKGAKIKNELCVSKSYPKFFEDLDCLRVN